MSYDSEEHHDENYQYYSFSVNLGVYKTLKEKL